MLDPLQMEVGLVHTPFRSSYLQNLRVTTDYDTSKYGTNFEFDCNYVNPPTLTRSHGQGKSKFIVEEILSRNFAHINAHPYTPAILKVPCR